MLDLTFLDSLPIRRLSPLFLCPAVLLVSEFHARAVAIQDDRPDASAESLGAFGPDRLHERAAALAADKAPPMRVELPAGLGQLDYDGYRAIRCKPEGRLLAEGGGSFRADALHLGSLFDIPVELWVVEGGQPRRHPFDPADFEYAEGEPEGLERLRELGHSGLRLRYPIDRPDVLDEFLVFQGASYFRGVGRDQGFGTSARGLAVRTADPTGEEFPAFTEFWVEAPAPGATEVTLHALLESESLTGVYRFEARPGDETVVQVDATLYPRRGVERFGLAPLTSMFLFDAKNRSRFDDFRGAVCDTNGLQIVTGSGERVWRPMANPVELQVSSFIDERPKGFGLMQRNREFEDFGDTEARYERRPSVWVEPVEGFERGSVVLIEIPLEQEFNDNIVAYWQPERPLEAGVPRRFSYRLRFCDAAPDDAPLARVAATRTGRAPNDGRRLFVIDFTPDEGLGEAPFQLSATASTGSIAQARVERLPDSTRRRATISFEPADSDVSELRVALTQEGEVSSEVWLYRWTRR